ncbi:hypothetical protein OE88DRAFT_1646789 [Heliocybe sulcata]|uniref:Uncharacterized protein n=1 Tax=Heliocybe sulcata TaxID=5364 RepID=A0A5C3MU91_9AGAM|nr:hypothetical protein OE88DRAFT_1646789 [Heliocybe sulcata]
MYEAESRKKWLRSSFMVGRISKLVSEVGEASSDSAQWVYDKGVRGKNTVKYLMAYILDLNFVLRELFWLMREDKSLGPVHKTILEDAILAFRESQRKDWVHQATRDYAPDNAANGTTSSEKTTTRSQNVLESGTPTTAGGESRGGSQVEKLPSTGTAVVAVSNQWKNNVDRKKDCRQEARPGSRSGVPAKTSYTVDFVDFVIQVDGYSSRLLDSRDETRRSTAHQRRSVLRTASGGPLKDSERASTLDDSSPTSIRGVGSSPERNNRRASTSATYELDAETSLGGNRSSTEIAVVQRISDSIKP